MAMDASAHVRRRDTTKGPPLRILSLDGGGVRGYSMLIILQELMHRTFVETEGRAPKQHEIPKPCDHFDMIAGTGTGGLIAIMLGRLRLDLETCKEVYVRMTRKVFETDKTFAGIPYKGTLFKASKLEEAIKECVKEHTIFEDEGNDALANAVPMTPDAARSPNIPSIPQRAGSNASRYSSVGMTPTSPRHSLGRFGNPDTRLYDSRDNRTKTAVTAVYKGTPKNGSSVLLRSYDSRKEPATEYNCTIWQAGRATAATGLAFKPIQVGQSVFIDEGAGKYNPAPQILDEAVRNEWPGREVGVFVSIGTGKRPGGTNHQQHEWWEGFVGNSIGDFAEARRRLINKIEGCEDTHQFMQSRYLAERGVNVSNYFRFNVEVGVGEFGMNEWARLSEISTNTRMYLTRPEVQDMNQEASAKLAKVHLAMRRQTAHNRQVSASSPYQGQETWDRPPPENDVPPPSHPMAIELPANEEVVPSHHNYAPGHRPQYHHTPSMANMKYTVISSDEYPQPMDSAISQQLPYRPSLDQTHRSNGSVHTSSPRQSVDPQYQQSPTGRRSSPPPLPPKTPLPYPDGQEAQSPRTFTNMGNLGRMTSHGGSALPYPDSDAPPPTVNLARKPEYGVR